MLIKVLPLLASEMMKQGYTSVDISTINDDKAMLQVPVICDE